MLPVITFLPCEVMRPARMLSRELLPAPLGPSSAQVSLYLTVPDTFLRTTRLLTENSMFSQLSVAGVRFLERAAKSGVKSSLPKTPSPAASLLALAASGMAVSGVVLAGAAPAGAGAVASEPFIPASSACCVAAGRAPSAAACCCCCCCCCCSLPSLAGGRSCAQVHQPRDRLTDRPTEQVAQGRPQPREARVAAAQAGGDARRNAGRTGPGWAEGVDRAMSAARAL
mmetsp:Transcript_17645/g.56310  ORF Transcript_17645/g.56310 Transcript_17645/m.56310 type:complete len:227 (+) Transcript_17645:1658-2338(+)